MSSVFKIAYKSFVGEISSKVIPTRGVGTLIC